MLRRAHLRSREQRRAIGIFFKTWIDEREYGSRRSCHGTECGGDTRLCQQTAGFDANGRLGEGAPEYDRRAQSKWCELLRLTSQHEVDSLALKIKATAAGDMHGNLHRGRCHQQRRGCDSGQKKAAPHGVAVIVTVAVMTVLIGLVPTIVKALLLPL